MPSTGGDMHDARDDGALSADPFLRTVLAALPVGVLIADRTGALVEANLPARRMLRGMIASAGGEEPGGQDVPLALLEDLRLWPLTRALEGGEPCLGEFIDVTFPDATRGTLHMSAVPVCRGGMVVGGIAVLQEVTASRRRELLSLALNDVNAAVLSLLDIPEHMRSVLADGALALGADAAVLAVREGGEWIARQCIGLEERCADTEIAALLEARIGEGVTARVESFEATGDGASERGVLSELGFTSLLVAPLTVTERSRGVVAFLSRGPFDEDAEDFARKLATSVSLALRSAEAFERAHAEVLRARLLEEVAVAASSGLDLETIGERVLAALRDRMQLLAGAVALREGDELRMLASFGVPAHDAKTLPPLPLSDAGHITTAAVERGMLLTHDDLARRHGRGTASGADSRSYMSAPLTYAGRILGVLDLVWEKRRPFSSDERELVAAVAQTLAQAVENARLFRETRENERLSRALNDIDAYLTAAVEIEEMTPPVLRAACAALGTPSACLLSFDGGEWEVLAVHNLPGDHVGRRYPQDDMPYATRCLTRGEVVCVDDVEKDPGGPVGFMASEGVRSVLNVPLLRGDDAFGCLSFRSPVPLKFTAAQRDFGVRLGAHISLALRTARLFAAQRNIAQTLQEAMLALPRDTAGVLVSQLYQSASLDARVGGDFYDVFELDNGLLGVVIGDVSGKGLDAAVLTALVKNTLRAHAVVKRKTPADVVALVNTVLLKESRPETFVTLFFGMLDRRDGRFVYCNAGHPSAVVLHEDGMAARLAPNSPIAGAFPSATFRDGETHVGLDDLIFLYTDGLTEARRDRELYGEERLFVQLARVCDTTPEEAIRRVVDDVVAFASNRLVDDVAVLAIKRVPLPSEMPVQQKLPLWTGR